MAYDYLKERMRLFTEDGQVVFLAVRDTVAAFHKTAGACTAGKVMDRVIGDSDREGLGACDTWLMLACLDRLVEIGEIREVSYDCFAQDRVFVQCKSREY